MYSMLFSVEYDTVFYRSEYHLTNLLVYQPAVAAEAAAAAAAAIIAVQCTECRSDRFSSQ